MDQAAEIAQIKSTVARFFVVYDVRVSYETVQLMVNLDQATLEDRFEKLRKEMYALGYIPVLDYSKGEYAITVVRKPPAAKRRNWVNLALLIATACTTIYAGTVYYADYISATDIYAPENFLWGAVFFALPLMTILGVHELSHYYMSKKHGVDASLPYFIPLIPPLGTMGAFISMREPMPNKKALVDIGVAGPIGGFLVTIPIAIIGLALNAMGTPHPGTVPGGMTYISIPFFLDIMTFLIPQPPDVFFHPTAFAAWVGFFVSAINLLPAGQLDGGHIARGLLGKNARIVSYVTVFALFFLGVTLYLGWLIFAALILFLGMTHPAPLNDVSKVDSKRIAAGALAVVILFGSFVFVPFYVVPADGDFTMEPLGGNETVSVAGGTALFEVAVNNTGTVNIEIQLDVSSVPAGWSALLYLSNGSSSGATNSIRISVPYEGNASVRMEVWIPDGQGPGTSVLTLGGTSYWTLSGNNYTGPSASRHFTVLVS